jgi:hypothetical protein
LRHFGVSRSSFSAGIRSARWRGGVDIPIVSRATSVRFVHVGGER